MTARQESGRIGAPWSNRPAGRTRGENVAPAVASRWVAAAMAWLAAATALSCGFVPVGIPMEETRVLSSEVHRADKPSDEELRVTFSGLSSDGHSLLGQVREVGRCKRWKTSRIQVVSTTAYRRRHMPAKAWGWVSTLAGVGLSALGVGLMAANAQGLKGNRDDLEADLQRRRFIGGIWSLLPGLGLGAMGITWLALDAEKTVVEKGPVQRIRQPQGLQDCRSLPLVHETLKVSPADSGQWTKLVTDGRGRFRLDLLDLLAKLPLASVPTSFLFTRSAPSADTKLVVRTAKQAPSQVQVSGRGEDQSAVVSLDDDLGNRVLALLRNDEITVDSGRNSWTVRLGGNGVALVSRVVLTCGRHFDLTVTLSARDVSAGTAPDSRPTRNAPRKRASGIPSVGNKPDKGPPSGPLSARALEKGREVGLAIDGMGAVSPLVMGADRRLFCGPEAVPRLRIAAYEGKPHVYELRIEAEENRPAGRVLRIEGRLLALDKGTAQRVLVGRRGVLFSNGKKVGGFSVVQVTRSNAAARLDGDLPSGVELRRLTYRLVD